MPITFLQQSSVQGTEHVRRTIQEALTSGLHVLWLLSGGSNVELECAIARDLPAPEGRLVCALIDERYGPVGHADSNYQKLVDAGFTADDTNLLPVLQTSLDIAATAATYNQALQQAFADADIVIGQLGIGADGHTAGILPDSVAITASGLVTHYSGPDFERITLTFEALTHIDTAFVFAYGNDKQVALTSLAETDIDLAKQPSQILKQIPSVYVYNDQVGGEA